MRFARVSAFELRLKATVGHAILMLKATVGHAIKGLFSSGVFVIIGSVVFVRISVSIYVKDDSV